MFDPGSRSFTCVLVALACCSAPAHSQAIRIPINRIAVPVSNAATADLVPKLCAAQASRIGSQYHDSALPAVTAPSSAALKTRLDALGSSAAEVQNRDSRISARYLNYQMCGDSSDRNREITAATLLDDLFLTTKAISPGETPGDSPDGVAWKLASTQIEPDSRRTLVYQQTFDGKPVLNTNARVRFDPSGTIVDELFVTALTQEDTRDLRSQLAKASAASPRQLLTQLKQSEQLPPGLREGVSVNQPLQLVVYKSKDGAKPAYVVETSSNRLTSIDFNVVIDAYEGNVLSIQGNSAPSNAAFFLKGEETARTLQGICGESKCQLMDSRVLQVEDEFSRGGQATPARPDVTVAVTVLERDNAGAKRPLTVDKVDVSHASVLGPPASDLYANFWSVLELLAGKLGYQSYDNKGGTIMATIGTSPIPSRYLGAGEFEFGKATGAMRYGGFELELVGHEMAHAIIRSQYAARNLPLTSLCVGMDGEPFFALEESLADTFGLLAKAVIKDSAMPANIGKYSLGDQWRNLLDPNKGTPFPIASLKTAYETGNADSLFTSWKAAQYAQPKNVSEHLAESCLAADKRLDLLKYINMGVFNAFSYKLINAPSGKRPVKYRQNADWNRYMLRIYLDVFASDELYCTNSDACYTSFCSLPSAVRAAILSRSPDLRFNSTERAALVGYISDIENEVMPGCS